MQDSLVLGSFLFYLAGIGLSNMDAFLLLVMWGSRMVLIAVKYAYRFANGTQIPHEAHRPKNASLLIPRSYYDAYMCPGCVAEYALAKGGIRLANTLNLIFEEEEGAMMVQ